MQPIDKHKHGRAVIVSLALLAACLGPAACGGSSSSSKSATGSSTSATSTNASHLPTGQPGALAGRFAATRACLKRSGITLPAGPPAGRNHRGGAPAGGFFIGGRQAHLPKGVTAAQLREAFRKCGSASLRGPGRLGAPRIKSPVFRTALSRFAACMKSGGVKLPTPNASGTGPVFDTRGLDIRSPKFKAAIANCRSLLSSVIGGGSQRGRSGPGTAAGPGNGAP